MIFKVVAEFTIHSINAMLQVVNRFVNIKSAKTIFFCSVHFFLCVQTISYFCVCVFVLIRSVKTAVITESNPVRPQGRLSTMYRPVVIIPQ